MVCRSLRHRYPSRKGSWPPVNIHTLVPDIYSLLKRDDWLTPETSSLLSSTIAVGVGETFTRQGERRSLRMSSLGPKCPRALWYSIHHPELAEELPPWAKMKYSYGNIIEHMTIALAKAAGHKVTGEQDELLLDGVTGHRDCVIDGCVVDVKSCSTFQFAKYKTGAVEASDEFGYLDQLDAYGTASLDDPLVLDKEHAYILAIDKTLGHISLYEHIIRSRRIRDRIGLYQEYVGRTSPPTCECKTEAYGVSGNFKLDVRASYSPYKYLCFPHLRTFLYSTGPVYLTKVIRKPEVIEVDKYNNPIL